jgi:hypothetical protein
MPANTPHSAYFCVAAFTPDGELVGTGMRKLAELSPKWLSVCQALLDANGSVFRISPGQTLSHIELKLTSADGAGLGAFFVHGHLATSTAYFRGAVPEAEAEVQRMFLASLRPSKRLGAPSGTPFEALLGIPERPLHVVIPWANPRVSDEDYSLLRELSDHFAGVFLCGAGQNAA